jgi:hypothetical protein
VNNKHQIQDHDSLREGGCWQGAIIRCLQLNLWWLYFYFLFILFVDEWSVNENYSSLHIFQMLQVSNKIKPWKPTTELEEKRDLLRKQHRDIMIWTSLRSDMHSKVKRFRKRKRVGQRDNGWDFSDLGKENP